jgi:hypothetical protein
VGNSGAGAVALALVRRCWPSEAASGYSIPRAGWGFVCLEIPMIESNHDMRNPADFLALRKLAEEIL